MAAVVSLKLLPEIYAIARLPPAAPWPGWADGPGVVSMTRTADELSVLCAAGRVPEDVRQAGGWRGLVFQGPFAFTETGIAASVLAPLAAAEIPVLLISSFETDILFLKAPDLPRASSALELAGHLLV